MGAWAVGNFSQNSPQAPREQPVPDQPESRPRPHSAIIASPTNLQQAFHLGASSIHSSCSGSCSASVNWKALVIRGRGSVVDPSKPYIKQRTRTFACDSTERPGHSNKHHDGQGRRRRGDQGVHPKPRNDHTDEVIRAAREEARHAPPANEPTHRGIPRSQRAHEGPESEGTGREEQGRHRPRWRPFRGCG